MCNSRSEEILDSTDLSPGLTGGGKDGSLAIAFVRASINPMLSADCLYVALLIRG